MVFKSFLSKPKDIDILSAIPDGIMLINAAGKIEWTNDVLVSLFCIDKNEILNHSINEIIESGLELVRQAAESFKPVVGRIKPTSGKDSYFEITANFIDGHYVVSLRDVTQNYKTVTNIMVEHESSQKVNKDKNVFLNKLSNELKSPLQSAIGFSQAMIDGLGGAMSEKQEKYIKIINKNSSEILYLINKIIEHAKTESNLLDHDFQIFDASNTLQTVLKEFDQTIKAKNLSLNLDMSELVKKTVFSDENSLKIILQNIMESSINSTDIGSINIKVSHPDKDTLIEQNIFSSEPDDFNDKAYMMLKISDTGAGISETDLETIFDPYTQLEKSNKKYIVRSIALASAKNIVKYLKGVLWIDSEPMQGSTFNLILPIEKSMS